MKKSALVNKSALEIFIALHNTRGQDKGFRTDIHRLTDDDLQRISEKMVGEMGLYPRRRKFYEAVWKEIKLLTLASLDQKISRKLNKDLGNDE